MKDLEDIGFKKVGNWTLTEDRFSYAIQSNLDKKDLLYSFISDEKVFYIGKTTDSLKNRMNGYKNAGGSQRTNIRINNKIKELLNQRKQVYIFILLDDANLKFKNYRISLASGLEDSLIAAIKPEWNFRGNNRIKEQELPSQSENVVIESSQPTIVSEVRTVEIKLGKEYWTKGFFNFSQRDRESLPDSPTQVTLLLGKNDDFFIEGSFLFATQDKQPRVHGNRSLKEWFQENFNEGDRIKVDILKSTVFRIR